MMIYDLVYEQNKGRKDDIALEYEGNSIRFGEFFDAVDEKTEYFASKGINQSSIVTMSMLMTPEFAYDWYSLSRLGALSNLVDPRTSIFGLKKYLEEAGSTHILSTGLFGPKFIRAMGKDGDYRLINYSLSESAEKMPLILGTIDKTIGLTNKIIANFDSRVENYDGGKLDLSHSEIYLPNYVEKMPLSIVHTGGTTNTPKGTLSSHDNYNAMAWEYLKSDIGFMPDDRFLLVMPGWIGYGSGMLHMSLVRGMRATMISKLESKKMGNYLLKYKPQWLAGVPAHLRIIKDSRVLRDADLSFLKGMAVGGDSTSAELFEEANDFLMEHGAKKGVFPGYASTEITAAGAVRQKEKYVPGSVGIPLPGCVVGIFKYDEETEKTLDEELDYNQEGEICWQTPNQMLGYFKDDVKTSEVIRTHSDGRVWLHTGDLGHINDDGILFVDGRIKDLITRHDGFKVYPHLIEELINACKGVTNCKVVGVSDVRHIANGEENGQVPMAFISIENDTQKERREVLKKVISVCKSTLPSYYVDGLTFEFIDSMPRTPVGKISSNDLRVEAKKRIKI